MGCPSGSAQPAPIPGAAESERPGCLLPAGDRIQRNTGQSAAPALVLAVLPEPDEIEILVEAAGLNFIDVLDTLGLLPFERDWLGVECAGEVVTVGTNVTHLGVGDRVMALAAGSFAQYVTVPAALAVPQPEGFSATEAATIPANFLTGFTMPWQEVRPGYNQGNGC